MNNEQVTQDMEQQKQQIATPIFYSYAHKDDDLRKELVKHLSLLRRQNYISEWHDRKIVAGEKWKQEIDMHMEIASIILLLISPDYLVSDYCYDIEMQRALERDRQGKARVIPIFLRPVDWKSAPFAHLQGLPRDGKPVTTWDSPDIAFSIIAEELREIIEQSHLPEPPLLNIDRKNRIRLLKKVRTDWIDGLLKQSLPQASWIDLHLQEQPDALGNRWQSQVQELRHEPYPLPDGTDIVQVYDEADGELLILGEPGSGKTTLLLQLTSTLLDRALVHEDHLIPVVFKLSSWAQKKQKEPQLLSTWFVEELEKKYKMPRQVADYWVKKNQILPLLDGLDEVASEARTSCMQAIIAYYFHHPNQAGTSLVLCCRSTEYYALSQHLPLQRAVTILPLTAEQVDEYLSKPESQLEGLRDVLHEEAELAELVSKPLMLNILALVYQGATAEEIQTYETSKKMKTIIFDRYVEKMLSRRMELKHWKPKQVIHWLTFLAKQMQQYNLTSFSIESLQPTWLSEPMRGYYDWSVKLLGWLFVGLGVGITIGLLGYMGIVVLLVTIGSDIGPEEVSVSTTTKQKMLPVLGGLGGLLFGVWSGTLLGNLQAQLLRVLLGDLGGFLFRAIFFALIVLLLMVLRFYLPLFILRFWLWRAGRLPWNLNRFLDKAEERLLLHRVGRSYIFVHRLLLEYFVMLDEPVPTKHTTPEEAV